jgi:hypothetical protein
MYMRASQVLSWVHLCSTQAGIDCLATVKAKCTQQMDLDRDCPPGRKAIKEPPERVGGSQHMADAPVTAQRRIVLVTRAERGPSAA